MIDFQELLIKGLLPGVFSIWWSSFDLGYHCSRLWTFLRCWLTVLWWFKAITNLCISLCILCFDRASPWANRIAARRRYSKAIVLPTLQDVVWLWQCWWSILYWSLASLDQISLLLSLLQFNTRLETQSTMRCCDRLHLQDKIILASNCVITFFILIHQNLALELFKGLILIHLEFKVVSLVSGKRRDC